MLLFLKWDRFSRNVAEAYVMISRLERMGIEPQAIEQPLDFSVPESKIMLAIYLATPEVENIRRSLNTINGMRTAMKAGRHPNLAPIGYKNVRDSEGKNPKIVPGEKAAVLIWAFEEMAKGENNIMDVWKMARTRGLNVGKSQFWSLLRNPIYCGRIRIPAYKNEPEEVKDAVHTPLISVQLFEIVQDVLKGRKKARPTRNRLQEELPLRGFLQCKECGKPLTGSASKGNGGKYHYYHCRGGCKVRIKASEVNKAFVIRLEKLVAKKDSTMLYHTLLRRKLEIQKTKKGDNIAPLKAEIDKCKERIDNARQLMLDKEIEAQDYREIKEDYEAKIRKIAQKIKEIEFTTSTFSEQVEFCSKLLPDIVKYYISADLPAKRQIIGSIFSEKLIFTENECRTNSYNSVIPCLFNIDNSLSKSKNEKCPENSGHSSVVPRTGFEPAHLAALPPEDSASTNFAIWALLKRAAKIGEIIYKHQITNRKL